MSGRSAYVRKKITQTKVDEKEKGVARHRARSTTSSEENGPLDYAMPARQDTGIGTTNARFLKFSEPIREAEPMSYGYRHDGGPYGAGSSGSQSGGSMDGRQPHHRGPLEDFAYARARRPNIRTEDVSGIEKSGLRSAVDKKSEGVRRGLAKAFAFGKKHKPEDKGGLDFRPLSAATVRPPIPSSSGTGTTSPIELDLPGESMDGIAAQRQQPERAERAERIERAERLLHQEQIAQSMHSPATEHAWDINGNAMYPPPSAKLPPIPPSATAPHIKRWIGAGRPVQRWNKLRKDPELWDPNGDVLVFFGHKGQQPRPNPSFRLSSHIVEATESRYLITQLREGSTEEDIQLPPSPIGAPPMLQRHLAGAGGAGMSGQHLGPHTYGHGHGGYGMGQPTPPISEDNSLREADGQISYEMYFPTPSNMSKTEQLRHHITTRNVFALLYHASLVGLSLYQALTDLHARLEAYMPPETDNVGTIINYLGARGIDDVRNEPDAAVSILAWSESPDVRWEEGWRECFLHCAGMYAGLEACADYKSVTPITRALLERACLETQLRVQAAEERLADFHFGDMWPGAIASISNASGPVTASPAKAAADRLQKFLLAHYTEAYGRWPPLPPPPSTSMPGVALGGDADEDIWLTRVVAQAIQRDFAALYDYLVDRDIVWDGSEARSGRKWMLVSESGNRAFEADTPDLPMTDMLVEFDNRLRFPHIPHPYPLVPESIPATGGASGKKAATTGGRAGALERRVQLAYTVATNMLVLGSDFMQSDLIDAFSKFEKTDQVGGVDPSTARRGRWVLVYGVLQTLASVAVDAPNVRYRDGVSYHLSPRLKGAKLPPWRSMAAGGGEEAAHELSHCWMVSRTWHGSGENESSTASSGGRSGNTSPVPRVRSMASSMASSSTASGIGGGSYMFPRPPTMETATVRSGSTGYGGSAYYGGGGRSIRSSVSVGAVGGHSAGGPHGMPGVPHGMPHGMMPYGGPMPPAPFGSFGVYTPSPSSAGGSVAGGSVVSERSSPRPAPSSTPRRVRAKTARGQGIAPVVEEARQTRGAASGRPGVGKGSDVQLGGGFLHLDDTPTSDVYDDYMEDEPGARSGSGSGSASASGSGSDRENADSAVRNERPLLDGDDGDSMAPVIRDFDDLGVLDQGR